MIASPECTWSVQFLRNGCKGPKGLCASCSPIVLYLHAVYTMSSQFMASREVALDTNDSGETIIEHFTGNEGYPI